MKKTGSFFLAVLLMLLCAWPACAEDAPKSPVALHLRSDLDGLVYSDYERFSEILCDSVVFHVKGDDSAVYVSDYAGAVCYDPLKAGRTYYVYYSYLPAAGCALPETIDEDGVSLTCDAGVRVYSYAVTGLPTDTDRTLQIAATVTVDGNLWQRFVGRLYDIYLKIRAWSLY